MITESPDREVLHKAVKHKADIVAIDEKETGLRATLKLRFTMLEGPENGVVLLEVHYFDLGFARGFSRLYCHHECLEVINMAHVSHGHLTLAFAVMHFFGDSPNVLI